MIQVRIPAVLLAAGLLGAAEPFPADPLQLKAPIAPAAAQAFLASVQRPGFLTLREIGRSAGGRPITLVHLNRGGSKARFRVLLVAQQHGNETSGKDALLYLVRRLAEKPGRLPEDVDLYVIPSLNPDGWASYRRTNDAGADLNRDHLCLFQPETQALYRVVREVQPHLAVDGHEFTRDGLEPGHAFAKAAPGAAWEKWPLVTMDGVNHPLLPAPLVRAGLQRVERAGEALPGIPYERYLVGAPSRDAELRPSAPDADDARNGIGSHGCLSFLIEAGIRRSAPEPQADLGARVEAYLKLFDHLLGSAADRTRTRALVEAARREPLPAFLPVNVLWASTAPGPVKVVEKGTGRVVTLQAGNRMTDLVVKQRVPAPEAYAVLPGAVALLRPLLERHGIPFEALPAPRRVEAETCRLLRVEEAFDEVYNRYGGRQIVARNPAETTELPAGSLLVRLDHPLARRAVEVLEPCMFYGLFQYKEFQGLAAPGQAIPVLRVMGAAR